MPSPRSNLAAVLHLIWSEPDLSRADVARRTGLSRSTVSSLVQQLIDLGAVHEHRVGPSSGGRPPVHLRFADQNFRMAGIDIGASHVGCIVMDARGRILGKRSQSHSVETDPHGTLALVNSLLTSVLAEVGLVATDLIGIGVAVPSPVHADRPGQVSPSILPDWRAFDLGLGLSEVWKMPAYLENDANLGALGERVWGQGRDTPDFAFVKLGTGVGAGLVVNGELYRGAEGIAGEIGHTAIDIHGPKCRCGLNGCLETLIGSDAIEKTFRGAHGGPTSTSLPPGAPVADIARQAALGDPLAAKVIGVAGHHLGVALANLLNIVNPARIVLGGRLALAGESLLAPVRAAIQARAMWTNVAAADVVTSSLQDEAVPIGAATLVLRTALADPTRLAEGLPPTLSTSLAS